MGDDVGQVFQVFPATGGQGATGLVPMAGEVFGTCLALFFAQHKQSWNARVDSTPELPAAGTSTIHYAGVISQTPLGHPSVSFLFLCLPQG